jgi:hypothetical protein
MNPDDEPGERLQRVTDAGEDDVADAETIEEDVER